VSVTSTTGDDHLSVTSTTGDDHVLVMSTTGLALPGALLQQILVLSPMMHAVYAWSLHVLVLGNYISIKLEGLLISPGIIPSAFDEQQGFKLLSAEQWSKCQAKSASYKGPAARGM